MDYIFGIDFGSSNIVLSCVNVSNKVNIHPIQVIQVLDHNKIPYLI